MEYMFFCATLMLTVSHNHSNPITDYLPKLKLATDKSRYFDQPRPIIVKCVHRPRGQNKLAVVERWRLVEVRLC